MQQEGLDSKTTILLLDSMLCHHFPPQSKVYICELSSHLYFVKRKTLRALVCLAASLTCFLCLQNSLVHSLRALQQRFAGLDNLEGEGHCSHLVFSLLSTSASIFHNKAGSSPASGGHGCFSPGQAQRNKLLLQACQWVWWLNRLLQSEN